VRSYQKTAPTPNLTTDYWQLVSTEKMSRKPESKRKEREGTGPVLAD
jgi:hypothetical protein